MINFDTLISTESYFFEKCYKVRIMKLRTKLFPFTKQIYYSILFKNSVKRNWWVLVLTFSFAVYQYTKEGFGRTFLIVFGLAVIFSIYLMVRCLRHVAAKKNRLFYADRYFEIDNQVINCRFTDGSSNQVKLNTIRRVVRTPHHFELYVGKKQFIYLPVSAFENERDYNIFVSLLKSRDKA